LSEPPGDEVGQLRVRAERCRSYAREYATDVGSSLCELAVELDARADRLGAKCAGEALDGSAGNGTPGDVAAPPLQSGPDRAR
jgi:hypothetical protein